ncbi:uncharacterized protein KY384_000664 [Bacidia gigantensis]|uniref:uncharacterized protein n=1 Tax=Bacidia gigantensis TaxID=2732470 RepID=UPI001D037BA9|nr:uncharacterized protein KY384_000664 [Bacidia gigantensis]KAG8525902.1 hypothetical protein KY384_000664 [Bacidia gigantensis]
MADATKYTNKLHSKRVLILGGSSGIGFGVAEASLEHGAHVTISSSSQSRVDSAVASLTSSYPSAKSRIQGFTANLSTPDLDANIHDLFTKTTNSGKEKLDHVVFTAGDHLSQVPLVDTTLETLQKAAMVRFNAPLLTAKHAASFLNPGPGSSIIITTGSVSEKPIENWAVVGSYAAGAHGMMRGIALDLRPVRCNLISPGFVDTEMWDHLKGEGAAGGGQYEKLVEAQKKVTTTGRVANAGDIAE